MKVLCGQVQQQQHGARKPPVNRFAAVGTFDLSPCRLQTLKYSSKSHPGGDHRHEKMRDSSDVTPPCKMLRRSDSPENKHADSTGHSRTKVFHTHRARDRDGGETQWSFSEKRHGSGFHSNGCFQFGLRKQGVVSSSTAVSLKRETNQAAFNIGGKTKSVFAPAVPDTAGDAPENVSAGSLWHVSNVHSCLAVN